MKVLDCHEHGRVKWLKHIQCISCGRVYKKEEAEKVVLKNGNKCKCGLPLAPTKTTDGTINRHFSKPICPKCYKTEYLKGLKKNDHNEQEIKN